jgi:hypothetical protein
MAYVGGPIAAWKEAIEAEVKVTADRARAVRNVVRRNPELHKAYLEAYNAERGRTVRQ